MAVRSKRSREYSNEGLAQGARDHLIKRGLPMKNVTQSGNRVYVIWGLREYTLEFVLRGAEQERIVNFYLEHPPENINSHIKQAIVEASGLFDPKDLRLYKRFFKREDVKRGTLKIKMKKDAEEKEKHIIGEDKELPAIYSVTKMKEIPLGRKGYLSGDFGEYVFKYIMQPFMKAVG